MDLRPGKSYASLTQDHDEDVQSDEYPLLEPGSPERSLLWLKLAAKTLRLRGIPGEPMPIGSLPITRDELDGIQLWILAGAPERGVVTGVSERIAGCRQAPEEDLGPLPACDQNDPTLLLPDLFAEPPTDIRVEMRDGHRFLEFTTTVQNVGEGPLIIQAAEPATHLDQTLGAIQIILRRDGSRCSRPAGVIRLKPEGRWAYAHTANFELRKGNPTDGDLVALMSKSYFCLLDTDALNPLEYRPHQFEVHCTDYIGRMGISAGYKDVYHRVLPGQWMDLDSDPETAIDPGKYYLLNIANPTNMLWEKNNSREENLSYRVVTIRAADPDPPVGPPTRPPSPPPPPQVTPASPPPSPEVTSPPQPTPRPTRTSRAPRPPHAPRTPHLTRTPRLPRSVNPPRHPSHPVRAPAHRPEH